MTDRQCFECKATAGTASNPLIEVNNYEGQGSDVWRWVHRFDCPAIGTRRLPSGHYATVNHDGSTREVFDTEAAAHAHFPTA